MKATILLRTSPVHKEGKRMHGRKGVLGLAVFTALLLAFIPAQGQPPVELPAPAPQASYVPVTILLDLNAVKARIFQELPPAPGPVPVPFPQAQPVPAFPVPPGPVPGGRAQPAPVQPVPGQPFPPPQEKGLFQGKLLQKLKERKPLQKLMVLLGERLEVIQELEKISQPVSLGENLWLSLNLQEIVLQQAHVDGGLNRAVVGLAVRMEPTVVVSKEKPAVLPLPKFALGGPVLPPPPAGAPLDVRLRIDPQALPQVLPPEARLELAKYGIDCTKVTFSQEATPAGTRLVVTAPIEKPIPAGVKISFVPRIKDDVLTFEQPDAVVTATADGKADNSFNQTLHKLTQDGIRTFVVSKLKTTRVDLGPHLKQIARPPLGQPAAAPGKVQATINSLRVAGVGAANNNLIVTVAGVVSKEGIVVYAP
jgi:hypothetical protein